jgi:hypothetical protein
VDRVAQGGWRSGQRLVANKCFFLAVAKRSCGTNRVGRQRGCKEGLVGELREEVSNA